MVFNYFVCLNIRKGAIEQKKKKRLSKKKKNRKELSKIVIVRFENPFRNILYFALDELKLN